MPFCGRDAIKVCLDLFLKIFAVWMTAKIEIKNVGVPPLFIPLAPLRFASTNEIKDYLFFFFNLFIPKDYLIILIKRSGRR